MTGKATLPYCGTTLTSLSAVPLPEGCVVVLDLDDTLYPERDFVRSGFQAISRHVEHVCGVAVFDRLWSLFQLRSVDPIGDVVRQVKLPHGKRDLIDIYRNHVPNLHADPSVMQLLQQLKQAGHLLGLLTDGRSVTQRNKISALGLEHLIDEVVISEEFGSTKPDVRNYQYFEARFAGQPCVYVGDNLAKDFVAPNRLGWQTVGVKDRGQNIHPQELASCPTTHLPEFWIESLA